MPDIPVPLIGPSNEGVHPKADCQRTINLIPYKIERENEKTKWHLVNTPGLANFTTLPSQPVRGFFEYHDGRFFVVARASFYEVYEDGSYNEIDTITSTSGRVSMAELAGNIIIGDGQGFYAYDVAADTLTPIADAPTGRWCFAFRQRMFYVERGNTVAPGQVFYSEVLDPTNIPGANFFTAENKPDALSAAIPTEDQIWLFGRDSIEVQYDTGDATTPIQPVPGGILSVGITDEDTALHLDNSLWWVGRDEHGKGIVWRSNGFNALRMSVSAVERFLASATNVSAYGYQEDGHTYYVLNADEGTWALDIATSEWHERAWLDVTDGQLKRARPEIHAYAFDMHLVSDWENGAIYEASQSTYDDDGTPQIARRITGHMDLGGNQVTVDELWIDLATGVGLNTGQGSDPLLMFRYSRDGGQNWSNELHRKIGPIGVTTQRVRYNRLGVGRDWAFEVSISDPVQRVILGATARVRVGAR